MMPDAAGPVLAVQTQDGEGMASDPWFGLLMVPAAGGPVLAVQTLPLPPSASEEEEEEDGEGRSCPAEAAVGDT